jgi:tight adherence protein C
MQALIYFIISFTFFGVMILLALPLLMRPSREAERMIALVQSNRQDRRSIGLLEQIATTILNVFRKVRSNMGFASNHKVQVRMIEAGIRGKSAADSFFAVQMTGLLLCGSLGTLIPVNTMFWIFAGAVVGFMAPDFWLTAKARRRKERMRRGIPDAVDLLVICVDAGLGLDQALLRVADELSVSHPDLNEEFTRLSLERKAGTTRIDAWKALAQRTKIEELASFVTMLAETDRFGTPIVKALSTFSEEIRMRRRQHAEEAASKTKIKIIFPLVLCIFPCIFIVLLAPAILSIAGGMSVMSK